MKHRLVVVIGASIVLGVLLLPGSGQAANAGEACQIAGSATITPGLTLKPHSGTVSFSGNLTNCHGSGKGITSGSVTGSASGLGSCEAGKSHLSATISWNNGTSSSVSGVLVSGPGPAITEGKVTSGALQGAPVIAIVAFQPAGGPTGATACNKSTGLTSVTFQGVTL